MKIDMPIEMGHWYRNVYSEFEGIAIGYVAYSTGCDQVLLAPRTGDETKKPEAEWIDVNRLTAVDTMGYKPVHLPPPMQKQVAGGDKLPDTR